MSLHLLENIAKASKKVAIGSFKKIDKRTTIFETSSKLKSFAPTKRLSIVECFKKFTKDILPKMEETIEEDLIKRQLSLVQDEKIKTMILNSYRNRRILMANSEAKKLSQDLEKADIGSQPPREKIPVYSDVSIVDHDIEDIGKYTYFNFIKSLSVFQMSDIDKYFSQGIFGDYKKELMHTKKFSIMCTEESLRIVDNLKNIKPTKGLEERQKVITKILSENKAKEILEDAELYFDLVRLFSIDFLNALENYRKERLSERLFTLPSLFDLTINIIIHNFLAAENLIKYLIDQKTRIVLFQKIAEQIYKKSDTFETNAQNPRQWLGYIGTIDLDINETKLNIDFAGYTNKINELLPIQLQTYGIRKKFMGINSNLLLHGRTGSGKSGILIYCTLWAHKNNWVVVSVPSAKTFTHSSIPVVRHHETKLYVQPELAEDWLHYFYKSNQNLLEKIPVNQNIYGKYGYSGLHEQDPEIEDTYYPDRKTYLSDTEKILDPEELLEMETENERMSKLTAKKALERPKNLSELALLGIGNKDLATCVIYEILEQLYKQEEVPVLVAVDDYNYFYQASGYPSFRYANDKALDHRIPPYHMSLCRAFMQFDGHKIKNGYKICAIGLKEFYNHKFTVKKIRFPHKYDLKIEGIPLDDFRMMLEYYYQHNLWDAHMYESEAHEQMWMECQGNWGEALRSIIYHWRDMR